MNNKLLQFITKNIPGGGTNALHHNSLYIKNVLSFAALEDA